MARRDPERLEKLLAENRLKMRAAELVKVWAVHGVAVSPVVISRYWLVLERLRGQLGWLERRTDDVAGEVCAFAAESDILTMLGWNVRDEPALLVSASKLIATVSSLADIYPDGFVLIDEGMRKALVVDIDDEDGTRFNIADLPYGSA